MIGSARSFRSARPDRPHPRRCARDLSRAAGEVFKENRNERRLRILGQHEIRHRPADPPLSRTCGCSPARAATRTTRRSTAQTWCVFVRSPHAHALIRSIDTQAAAAAPGVVAVYTGTDYANDGIAMPKAAMPRKKRDGSPMFAPQRPAHGDRPRALRRRYGRDGDRRDAGAGEGRRRTGAWWITNRCRP